MGNTTPSAMGNWRRKKIRTLKRVLRGELPLATVLRNKWQKLKRFSTVNTVVEVELSKLLIGQQCGIPLKEWVERTEEFGRGSQLLGDSPYVDFLRVVDGDGSVVNNSEMLRETRYFQMSRVSMDALGSFMGKRSDEAIIEWMKVFYTLYSATRSGRRYSPKEVIEEGHSGKDEPIQVFRLRASEYYEIIDGHHRCAIAMMCGKDTVKVEVVGSRYSYLQQLVCGSNKGAEQMLQPLEAPEISQWPVVAGCVEKAELMLAFLRTKRKIFETLSFCDINCQYGYFMGMVKELGGEVFGVEAASNALQIARIKHSFSDRECLLMESVEFLQEHDGTFEVVLFHCPESFRGEVRSDIIRKLSRITRSLLFVDLGECGALQADIVEIFRASPGLSDIQPLAEDFIVCVKDDGLVKHSSSPSLLQFSHLFNVP